MRRFVPVTVVATLLVGCGATTHRSGRSGARTVAHRTARPPRAGSRSHRAHAATKHPRPIALVTDERQNLVAVVDLRSRTARRFIGVPAGPQYAAIASGFTVLTSPAAGSVSLLSGNPLRVTRVLHGFGAPHLVAIHRDSGYVYVTDDPRGTLCVIDPSRGRVVAVTHLGLGAHHMALSPDGTRLWIALGEQARTIVVVDVRAVHPHVIGRFDPGFPAHDLAFTPSGRQVWVSSAAGPDVTAFSTASHRPLFQIPVGAPPQHIAFGDGYAYLTSGYGSRLEQVSPRTGRIIRATHAPYGSFELDAASGFVVTSSLLDGNVAIFTPALRLLRVIHIGPATRDVAISP